MIVEKYRMCIFTNVFISYYCFEVSINSAEMVKNIHVRNYVFNVCDTETAKPKVSLLVILAKYFGVIKSRRTSRLGLVACMGQSRNAYRNFISKTKRKIPPERPGHR